MKILLKNKKGISTVVVTLLLVLITIAAVVLLANSIIPFVKGNLNKSTECLSYKDYYKFQQEIEFNGSTYRFNCNNKSSKLYGFSVLNAGGGKPGITPAAGFAVAFVGSQSVEKVNVESDFPVGKIRMLNSTKRTLTSPSVGEVQTYVYNSSNQFNSMEIYPVLKNGRTCDKTDTITINLCEDNINLN